MLRSYSNRLGSRLVQIYISISSPSILHKTIETGSFLDSVEPELLEQSPGLSDISYESDEIVKTIPHELLTQIIHPLRSYIGFYLEPYLILYVLIWFIGVLLLSIWRLVGWFGLRKLKLENVKPIVNNLKDRFQKLQEKLSIRTSVVFLESSVAKIPLTIGWIKPVVLIPVSVLTGLHPDHLEIIVVHELAHIRRHDYLFNLIQTIIETLYFYHPGCMVDV